MKCFFILFGSVSRRRLVKFAVAIRRVRASRGSKMFLAESSAVMFRQQKCGRDKSSSPSRARRLGFSPRETQPNPGPTKSHCHSGEENNNMRRVMKHVLCDIMRVVDDDVRDMFLGDQVDAVE